MICRKENVGKENEVGKWSQSDSLTRISGEPGLAVFL